MSANDLKSLSELFEGALFRIPDYQRGYSWETLQFEDFWKDLTNIPEGRSHYTGMLSLKKLDHVPNEDNWGSGEKKVYSIIDGQQRLTTCLICLNEILKCIKSLPEYINKDEKEKNEITLSNGYTIWELEKKYIGLRNPSTGHFTLRFDYDSDHPSSAYLRRHIFNVEQGPDTDKSLYTINLDNAQEFFHQQLCNKKMKELENILSNLTTRLKFNMYQVDNDEDVFVAFETMNNRGKQLSNVELLKNRLIYLTTNSDKIKEQDKQTLRKKINETWKEIYKQLGRGKVKLLDNEFLKAHWILYFRYTRNKGNDYINDLLNKYFAIHPETVKSNIQDVETKTDIDAQDEDDDPEENENEQTTGNNDISRITLYNDSLANLPKYWYATWFPSDPSIEFLDDEEKLWLNRLNRIGIGYFRPLIAAVLSKHDLIAPPLRNGLYKAIERFIFIHFRLGTANSSQKSTDYHKIAREIYNFEGSDESLKKKIEEITCTLTETTNTYLESDINIFIGKAKDRFNEKKGFYKWDPFLPYLLFEYDYHLHVTTGRESLLDGGNFFKPKKKGEKNQISIEHIYPQTPDGIMYWESQFKDCSEEKKAFFTNSLGNLLPLAKSINSALQNYSFEDKKKGTARKAGYKKGSLSEIEVSDEQDWGPEEIKKRGVRILEFMKKHWNIFTITDEQIEEITDYKKMKS